MSKYLLTTILLSFIFSTSDGQYLEQAIDSAVKIRYADGMIPVEGYDSIEHAIVNNYIQKEVVHQGIFNWPSQVIDFYPSETYRHLLGHKYNIAGPISHGCVTPSYQHYYDSIVASELKKKYGNDFFEKSRAEADLLDSNKMGLTLPYLANSQESILSSIEKELPFIDTFRFANSKEPIRFIIIHFRNKKLDNAYFGESVWGIQTSLDLMGYSETLTRTLSKLKWIGPTFEGKPTEKSILFDLKEQTFSFYGW